MVLTINFTGRITALHCERGYIRGSRGDSRVNSLDIDAVIVEKTVNPEGIFCRSDPGLLHSLQLLPVFTESF